MTMREAIIQVLAGSGGAKPEMGDFASGEAVKKLVERFNAAHVAHGLRCERADRKEHRCDV